MKSYQNYLNEFDQNENIDNGNYYEVQEDYILMSEETKLFLIDQSSFLDYEHFVFSKTKGLWILWIDWMNKDQFDEVSKILGFKY